MVGIDFYLLVDYYTKMRSTPSQMIKECHAIICRDWKSWTSSKEYIHISVCQKKISTHKIQVNKQMTETKYSYTKEQIRKSSRIDIIKAFNHYHYCSDRIHNLLNLIIYKYQKKGVLQYRPMYTMDGHLILKQLLMY
jgi:hypothetical protein